MEKLEIAAQDQNYIRLQKVALSALEVKELKKMPETYYYLAQSYAHLAQDERFFEKNPDAIKLAVSYMLKGIRKDPGKQTLISKFSDVRDLVIESNNKEAFKQYNTNKYSKSAKMYGQSFSLDTTRLDAYFLQAKSYLGSGDSVQAAIIYKALIELYSSDFSTEKSNNIIEVDPFVYFIDGQWMKHNYDSAILLISEARKLLGDDAKLSFYLRKITLDIIKDMPPSELMLDYVQEVLHYIPTAAEFLQKENAIYIYLIKNSITHNHIIQADSLIQRFVREKTEKNKLTKVSQVKEVDVFVERKGENILWKLAEYFQQYNHPMTASYVLTKYMNQTTVGDLPKDTLSRWQVISNYAYQTKPLAFACFIVQEGIRLYPNDAEMKALRTQVINEKSVVKTTVDEQGALYRLVKDEYEEIRSSEILNKLEAINAKYFGLLIANNQLTTAKSALSDLIDYFPNEDHSDQLELLAREDFFQNYYNTRTMGTDINGNEITPYVWDGRVGGCNEGKVDSDIQNKVVNRINYFRRNAGLSEVVFDEATNEYCQKAALMMTANNALSHNPPKTWRCWSSEGAYALKHSLLIEGANTSMAVTYIMDDKSSSAGNRRWLLYPNGRVYGHGSTNNHAVIWALDDSGTTDSTAYMNTPITWPPKGYLPQLMLMENWTFSLDADLTDAYIYVMQDDKLLDVSIEPLVDGYGLPTLVFKPVFDKRSLPKKSNFEVGITLSDGRQFKYNVRTFDYNPLR